LKQYGEVLHLFEGNTEYSYDIAIDPEMFKKTEYAVKECGNNHSKIILVLLHTRVLKTPLMILLIYLQLLLYS
jgi:hypothetical protein